MRDIARQLLAWHEAGDPYAVASVIAVEGSAPRELGAALAVHSDGTVVGSVSGGCVEGAVYELAMQVIETGQPVRERFGYADSDAFAVGLTCGGKLDIFVQSVVPQRDSALRTALREAGSNRPAALCRIVNGPAELTGRTLAVTVENHLGSSGDRTIDDRLFSATSAMLEHARNGLVRIGQHRYCDENMIEAFVESWAEPARFLVFGATDHAGAVTEIGRFLNYHVTVCDARGVFATAERFPSAHEVVVDWPHRYLAGTRTDSRTVICVLTHEAKFDVPVLVEALRRPHAYVGALGSRRTCADRLNRLRAAGLSDTELAGLRSPIGLNIGARTPEETAVSIASEIVAARGGGSGLPLSTTDEPIHPGRAHDSARPLVA